MGKYASDIMLLLHCVITIASTESAVELIFWYYIMSSVLTHWVSFCLLCRNQPLATTSLTQRVSYGKWRAHRKANVTITSLCTQRWVSTMSLWCTLLLLRLFRRSGPFSRSIREDGLILTLTTTTSRSTFNLIFALFLWSRVTLHYHEKKDLIKALECAISVR